MSEKKTKRDTKDSKSKEVKRRPGSGEGEQASEAKETAPEDLAAAAEESAGAGGEDESARYMRLAADFQNYKKRTEKEKSDIYAYAIEKFAADILDVIDNFERAIAQDATSGADDNFIEGMKLIMEQLVNVLERNDIEEIAALGEEFDPNLHHAVQMEDSKEYDSGKVTNVIQKGYKIKEKVLRPSMVVVAG
jgi:molecular chaperone GrpE